NIEIIAAGHFSQATLGYVQKSHPAVRLLRATGPVSVPRLRSWGLREATGDIVALLEDHCVPAPDWLHKMTLAQQSGREVVSGAVENRSTARIVDWAVYLFEYSEYMNPITRGQVKGAPGNNISYKREVLSLFKDLLELDVWESFWHRRLADRGIILTANPNMIVYHQRSFGVDEFSRLACLHGHNYAASRPLDSRTKRWFWITGAIALPLIILFRIAQRVFVRRRHWIPFIAASPVILWFAIAWTYGEITGMLTKRPKPESGWKKLAEV